jgi:GxxExxY protein
MTADAWVRRRRGPRHVEVPDDVNAAATRVIDAAVEVHRTLGPGFMESVYEEALAVELRLRGIPFERQSFVPIQYKGYPVGQSRLDLLVEGKLIVELKAVEHLSDLHLAQGLAYLKATGLPLALLVNFNVPVLLRGVKRVVRTASEPEEGIDGVEGTAQPQPEGTTAGAPGPEELTAGAQGSRGQALGTQADEGPTARAQGTRGAEGASGMQANATPDGATAGAQGTRGDEGASGMQADVTPEGPTAGAQGTRGDEGASGSGTQDVGRTARAQGTRGAEGVSGMQADVTPEGSTAGAQGTRGAEWGSTAGAQGSRGGWGISRTQGRGELAEAARTEARSTAGSQAATLATEREKSRG